QQLPLPFHQSPSQQLTPRQPLQITAKLCKQHFTQAWAISRSSLIQVRLTRQPILLSSRKLGTMTAPSFTASSRASWTRAATHLLKTMLPLHDGGQADRAISLLMRTQLLITLLA